MFVQTELPIIANIKEGLLPKFDPEMITSPPAVPVAVILSTTGPIKE